MENVENIKYDLYIEIRDNNFKRAMRLIEEEKEIDYYAAILNCIKKSKIKLLRAIIKNTDVDPSINNNAAFKLALERRKITVIKCLLEDDRVDPNVDNNFILNRCCMYKKNKLAEVLINHKKTILNANNNKAIYLAYTNKNFEIVDLLFSFDSVKESVKLDHPDIYNYLISVEIKKKMLNF